MAEVQGWNSVTPPVTFNIYGGSTWAELIKTPVTFNIYGRSTGVELINTPYHIQYLWRKYRGGTN